MISSSFNRVNEYNQFIQNLTLPSDCKRLKVVENRVKTLFANFTKRFSEGSFYSK